MHACCKKAKFDLAKSGRGFSCNLLYEGNNQPVAFDKYGDKRHSGRPDLQLAMFDDQAENEHWSELYFPIECKRLGDPPSANWNLNQNYVSNGVNRFCEVQSGYAKNAPSGAMVGYMQSSVPGTILIEVNAQSTFVGRPLLGLASGVWVSPGITRLDAHDVPRPISPSPIRLHHFWADLRHKKFDPPPTKAKKKNKKKPGRKKTSP